MELALKIIAGIAFSQLIALVLVVWLMSRKSVTANPSVSKPPSAPQEKKVAFHVGPNGISIPSEPPK